VGKGLKAKSRYESEKMSLTRKNFTENLEVREKVRTFATAYKKHPGA